MGGASSKKLAMPTGQILKRIEECMIPEERETVFDYMEMIDSKLTFPGALVKVSTEFKENDGVNVIFKILKRMQKDDVCVSLVVQLFDRMKTKIPVIMDFIQFGGLDLIERVMADHNKNKILMSEITKLMKAVLLVGAKAAITEIKNEADALLLCTNCQEALARRDALKSTGITKTIKIPTPKERAKRVLSFMSNYSDKDDVLEVGLEALLSYASNNDAKKTIGDTTFIEVVTKTIKGHFDNEKIIWRGCVALTNVGKFSPESASSYARTGIHIDLAQNFEKFDHEQRVQQCILWVFDSMLQWGVTSPSYRRVWQSEECMNLFKLLAKKRNKLLKKAVITDPYAPYKITIPLSVRSFMRESKGEVLPEDLPPPKEVKEFRKRRNFDEGAKFGTVDDEAHAGGLPGLVDKKMDPNAPKEWEKALTYKKKADQGGVKVKKKQIVPVQ